MYMCAYVCVCVFMVTRRVSTCTIVGFCNEELSTNSYNNDFTSPIVEHVVDQVKPLSVQIAKLTDSQTDSIRDKLCSACMAEIRVVMFTIIVGQ
jgi:hypothetical protein